MNRTMTLEDWRKSPHCRQEKSVLRHIQKNYKSKKEAIAIYVVLTQLVSDKWSLPETEDYWVKIMDMSWVWRDTYRKIINKFVEDWIITFSQWKKTYLPETKSAVYWKSKFTLENMPTKKTWIQVNYQGKKSSSIEEILEENNRRNKLTTSKGFDEIYLEDSKQLPTSEQDVTVVEKEKKISAKRKEKETPIEVEVLWESLSEENELIQQKGESKAQAICILFDYKKWIDHLYYIDKFIESFYLYWDSIPDWRVRQVQLYNVLDIMIKDMWKDECFDYLCQYPDDRRYNYFNEHE